MGDFFNSSQVNANANGPVSNNNTDRPDSIIHVSLSQVAKLTRKEDGLVIHRQKTHAIVCIGVVISVEELTTKNVYIINDYTLGAPVEVQLWKNENDGSNAFAVPPPIMENTYIRVVGQVRYDDSKPFIVAFTVAPITNPNEIYTHHLEVIKDSLILQKRMNHTLNNANMDANGVSSHHDTVMEHNSTTTMSGFSEVQRSVLNILNKYGRESAYGLKRYEIKSYMNGVNGSVIDEAIQFLADEGHIFSTTDEDTFKSTDY